MPFYFISFIKAFLIYLFLINRCLSNLDFSSITIGFFLFGLHLYDYAWKLLQIVYQRNPNKIFLRNKKHKGFNMLIKNPKIEAWKLLQTEKERWRRRRKGTIMQIERKKERLLCSNCNECRGLEKRK